MTAKKQVVKKRASSARSKISSGGIQKRRASSPTASKLKGAGSHALNIRMIQIWAAFAFFTTVGLILLFSGAKKERNLSRVQKTPEQTLQVAQQVAPPAPKPVHPLQATLSSLADKPFAERVHHWSYTLLKNPSLLAEFSNQNLSTDSLPLFTSKYDCTTFIETVYALARSSSLEQLATEIENFRYQSGAEGPKNFADRNHFMEVQWIPNNISSGKLKDVTSEFTRSLKIQTASEHKIIDQKAWFAKLQETQKNGNKGRSLASVDPQSSGAIPETTPENFKDGISARVSYVPVERFGVNRVKLIPDGAILNFVRENHPKHPVVITHQAIVLQTPKGTLIRHADNNEGIREEPLLEYMQSQAKKKWKLLGIQILSAAP